MVELGDRRVIPESVIDELKASIPVGILEAPDLSVVEGAEIEFVAGSLKGLNGKVLAQLPAKNRIQILLEFLGREITVEANPDDVLLAHEQN
jgi:transcription antitermination factor NusG